MTTRDTTRTVEAVWRIESARLVAGLTRLVQDIEMAEDLAQDALVAALEKWPETGVPANPGGWLMTTAKNGGIDAFRRSANLDLKQQEMARQLALGPDGTAGIDAVIEEHVDDDLLRLMFLTCHSALPQQGRTALTLKLVGGLSTAEIARAFLVPESTVAQRILRAKKTLTEQQVPFEVPDSIARAGRLDSVLGVIYLVFNEGYSATAGEDWMRPALCEEALRLGRILAELAPGEAEVHGLVALMEIQASRTWARTGPDGRPVLLDQQDRSRWDQLLVRRGLAALERAVTGHRAGVVRPAGRDRCLPRQSAPGRGHRLGPDCCGLRAAGAPIPVTGCGAQPCRGRVESRGARGGSGPGRHAAGRASAQGLPPAPRGAR